MKLVRWKRFTWDLSKLPPLEPSALPAHYHMRIATRDDAKSVKEVIFSSFSLDTAWSDTFKTFKDRLEAHIDGAFLHGSAPAIVISHGPRIIAASTVLPDVDAESHLTSGPCVRIEYRNRGIGTFLLYHSLKQLQQSGLVKAYGISKDTSPASKFVYPKFSSTNEAYNFAPSAVSS